MASESSELFQRCQAIEDSLNRQTVADYRIPAKEEPPTFVFDGSKPLDKELLEKMILHFGLNDVHAVMCKVRYKLK